jgi:Peptidase family M41
VKRLLDEAYNSAARLLESNRDLLEQLAEALLERETLDREEVELLAAGEKLPEAKQVQRAREFAASLRREMTSGRDAGTGLLAMPGSNESDDEVSVSADREADPTA